MEGIDMIERFICWLKGYLYIHIKGEPATRFVNICNGKDMYLWDIKKDHKGLGCYISLKNYKQLRPIAKKCGTIPYIKKRIGFPFIINKIKRRKVLFCSVLLFISCIYILSLYIWNIGFEGNYLHTNEKMALFLSDMNVKIGSRKKDIDCSYVETMIRKAYPDIGWVSVELKGTKLYVRIEETVIPKQAESNAPDYMTEADIIASREGIIWSILVRAGIAKVKVGDIVRKGDIIVSGTINVIGDSGDVISSRKIVPDADITMKTVEKYYDSFSVSYNEKQYTGIEKSGYDVTVFNNKLFSYNPSNFYINYDIIREVVNLRINKNFYLPFTYQKITYKEYFLEKKVYTLEEAGEIATVNLNRHLGYLMEMGSVIVSVDTKTEIIDGNCVTSGQIVLLEDGYEYEHSRSGY